MSEERCETCRFWRRRGEDLSTGTCRRYPPQPQTLHLHANPSPFDSIQPDSEEYDWCGEWKDVHEEELEELLSLAVLMRGPTGMANEIQRAGARKPPE